MVKKIGWLLLAANIWLSIPIGAQAADNQAQDIPVKEAVAAPSVPALNTPSAPAAISVKKVSPVPPGPKPTAATEPAANQEAEKPKSGTLLKAALDSYRDNPDQASLQGVLKAFAQLVAATPLSQSYQSAAHNNPVLCDLGARPLDAGTGRVWLLNKLPASNAILFDWQESKSTVTYTGRRHRKKHIQVSTSRHLAWLNLPAGVVLSQAHMFASAGEHQAILVGMQNGANLWLKTYHLINGHFAEVQTSLDSIPSFLTANMSGTVNFRGADLLLSVAPVVKESLLGEAKKVAEAPSSTYRFWLHLTDQGYVLMHRLPDEEQFQAVKAFLAYLGANNSEAARSLLVDEKLISIPRYIGLKSVSGTFHVAQMSSPPTGALRYRLITGGKDDLIFEVVHLKDKAAIRAIFIAAADPFLKEIEFALPALEQVCHTGSESVAGQCAAPR